MQEKISEISLTVFLLVLSGATFSQPEFGDVTHWDDGTSMKCPFNFEQEALYEWDQIGPPPITIETAATVARIWGEERGLTSIFGTNFRLIGVRPWGHDYGMWVMFVRYLGFPVGDPRPINDDKQTWLAITPTGTVVEPNCENAR